MDKNPISEIIKDTGVPAAIETIQEFATKIFGPAAEEVGELFRDHVRVYRWHNQIKILEKARAFAATANLEVGAVPLRTLVPLLEGASLEDQPILQDMWAALLASAAGNSTSGATRPAFVEIMKQFSPPEAWIISKWYIRNGFPIPTFWKVPDLVQFWEENSPYSRTELATAITNLVRLGLVSTDKGLAEDLRNVEEAVKDISNNLRRERNSNLASRIRYSSPSLSHWGRSHAKYNLTPLGFQFLHAVLPPVTRPIVEPWGDKSNIDELLDWEHLSSSLAREFEWIPELAMELGVSCTRTREEIKRREQKEKEEKDKISEGQT